MKIHKLLVFILLLATFVTYGQDPVLIPIPKKPMVSTRACPDMDAGSAGLYGYTGGEMASPTEVTLCANEAVFVKHNGDENLSGDPDPSTPAGIWYAAFTSEPDETGVLTPSQLADLPGIIEVDGSLIFVRADEYGNVTVINNGSFLEATNQTAPTKLWFAPFTIHNREPEDPTEYFENGDACIHINSGSAFSIEYLAPLTYEINHTSSTEGTITVSGGSGSDYDVSLTNIFNDTKVDLNEDDGQFHYSINRTEDNYRLTITDVDGGCTQSSVVNFIGGDPVKANIPDRSVAKGEELCLPITVENTNNLGIITFTYRWDPSVLEFNGLENIHSAIGGMGIGENLDHTDEGYFTIMWVDFDIEGEGFDIDEGDTLLEVCFTAIGEIGEQTPVYFDGSKMVVEFGTMEPKQQQIQLKNGTVTIVSGSDMDFRWSVCEGVLSAHIFGGKGPYEYTLRDASGNTIESDNVSTPEFTINANIAAGSYTLVITDSEGAESQKSIEIEDPPALTLEVMDNSCSDADPNGRAYITNLPADHSYKIEWTHNEQTSYNIDTLKNIREGEVRIKVKDKNNCTILDDRKHIDNNGIQAAYAVTQMIPCGGGTGEASITIEGGSGNYQYTAEGITRTISENPFTIDLYRTETSVRIFDDNNCVFDFTIEAEIEGGETIEIVEGSERIIHIACGTGTSSLGSYFAEINTTGNANDISKALYKSNGDQIHNVISTQKTELQARGLEAGDYYWIIKGACANVRFDFTIEDNNEEPITITETIQSGGCQPGELGSISLEISPADGDYTFEWDHGATTSDLSDLDPGEYTVTVTDTNTGCSEIKSYTIGDGIVFDRHTDTIDCHDPQPVRVGVTIRESYRSIEWETGETDELIVVDEPGYYRFTIMPEDEDCAPIVDSIYVPSAIDEVKITEFTEATIDACEMNAMVIVELNTPLPEVEFSWDDGPKTSGSRANTFDVFDEEIHNLKIYKDDCLAVDTSFSLVFKDAIKVTPEITHVTCFGEDNGRIEIEADISANYTYQLFQNGEDPTEEQIIGDFRNLSPGEYKVLIRDPSPSAPCPTIDIDFTIDEPDLLQASVDESAVIPPSCAGEEDGVIHLDITGGNEGSYQVRYRFPGGSGRTEDNFIDSVKAGRYEIRVSDSLGCSTDYFEYTMVGPDAIDFSIPPIADPECHGYTTPFTITSASGGTGSMFQYSVDGGVPVPLGEETPILAGPHEVVVYDENGCMEQKSITVNEPPAIEVLFQQPDTIDASLGQDVEITARIHAVNPIEDYIWMPSGADSLATDETLIFTAVDNVIVSLEVVDSDGCVGSGEIFVMVRKKRDIGIPNAFSPNGDGYNDLFTLYPGPSVRSIQSFQIFDRYGTLVWEKKDIRPEEAQIVGWDGTYQGSPASLDVYVAVVKVEYIDGQVIRRVSDVTLIK